MQALVGTKDGGANNAAYELPYQCSPYIIKKQDEANMMKCQSWKEAFSAMRIILTGFNDYYRDKKDNPALLQSMRTWLQKIWQPHVSF